MLIKSACLLAYHEQENSGFVEVYLIDIRKIVIVSYSSQVKFGLNDR